MGHHIELKPLEAKHWAWVKRHAAPVLCEDTKGIVAVRNGVLVAAVVFDSWSHNSCLSHIVIRDPKVTRRLIREGFKYVFVTCNRNVMLGLTPGDNEQALKFNKAIGFRVVHRIKDGHRPGVDYVLQEIRKAECRWLPEEYRKAA